MTDQPTYSLVPYLKCTFLGCTNNDAIPVDANGRLINDEDFDEKAVKDWPGSARCPEHLIVVLNGTERGE